MFEKMGFLEFILIELLCSPLIFLFVLLMGATIGIYPCEQTGSSGACGLKLVYVIYPTIGLFVLIAILFLVLKRLSKNDGGNLYG